MAEPLAEYFKQVEASDIADYGYGLQEDFLQSSVKERWDWIITNPPFRLAEAFIAHALTKANIGVAMLVRTTFIEGVGRYNRLFSQKPPTIFAQFVERVPMVKRRLDPTASTATGYCWLVWNVGDTSTPCLRWLPPCRKRLEFPNDYSAVGRSLLAPRSTREFHSAKQTRDTSDSGTDA